MRIFTEQINRHVSKIGLTFGALAIFALCALGAQVKVADAVTQKLGTTTAGLTSWWTFDEGTSTSVGDFSGQGNTGTASAGMTWGSGKRAKAGVFDGSTAKVTTANPVTVATTMTITGWVYKNACTTQRSFFSNRGAGGGSDYFGVNCTQMFFFDTNGTPQGVTSAAGTFTPGQWQFLAVTSDGATTKFYLNGQLVQTTAQTRTGDAGLAGLGWDPNLGTEFWDGKIDDVRVYNMTLSATDVFNLYRSGEVVRKVANNTSLLLYWPFDEGTSTSVGDASGNGVGGAISGTALWSEGKRENAIVLNGASYVSAPVFSSLDPGTNSFSVSTWVKTASPGNVGDIAITANSNAGSFTQGWGLTIVSFACTPGQVYFNLAAGGTKDASLCSNAKVNDGAWHLVTVVVDRTAATKTIYVDGKLDSSSSVTVSGSVGVNRFAVGQPDWQGYLTGSVDDLRYWGRALSASEVAGLYKSDEVKVNAPEDTRDTTGLIGYWTFNGKDVGSFFNDITGNGNSGYLAGASAPATSTVLTTGRVGQAVSFNNTNYFIDASTSTATNPVGQISTNAVSVSAWIYPYSTTTFMTVVSNDRDCGGCGSYRGYGLGVYYAGTTYFRIWNDTGAGPYAASTGNNPSSNEWSLVTGTFDGTTIKVYVNGVLQSSTTSVGDGTLGFPATFDTKIGQLGCCTNTYNMNGKIDEVRIYNRALSAAEIKKLYLEGK